MSKTIFILLDACQYEAGTRNLGYLEHMVETKQAAKYKVKGELPSLSRPMYATLLTGLPVSKHGITVNEQQETLTCESVYSMCKAQRKTTAAAAYHWMSELYNRNPFRIPKDRIQINGEGNIDYGIYYWEDMYPDSHVFADGEYLRKTYDPDFLMLHTMCIDFMGHRYGSETQQYELAIAMTGNIMASFIPKWLKEGYNVVITADHGMNKYGIHGGTDNAQRDTPLYIFSDQVKGGSFEEAYISELYVAPLLCRLLGIKPAKGMEKELPIAFIR